MLIINGQKADKINKQTRKKYIYMINLLSHQSVWACLHRFNKSPASLEYNRNIFTHSRHLEDSRNVSRALLLFASKKLKQSKNKTTLSHHGHAHLPERTDDESAWFLRARSRACAYDATVGRWRKFGV